jgi:CheY-like chemotaxis protein
MFTKEVLFMYSKTILIVDDWRLFLKMIEDIFRREQVNILTAKNGPEAVELIRKEKPDLVYMDLYMTGGNGDDACREVKNDPVLKSTPIVMVTSSNSPEDIERCQKAGCDAYIHKPFTRDEILTTSRKFIKYPDWSGKRTRIESTVCYGMTPGELFTGALTDISVGGIYVEAEEPLPIGTKLQLEFRLAQNAPLIRCKGRVAWIKSKFELQSEDALPGMGIEFIEIKKLDLLAIQTLVTKASGPQQHAPADIKGQEN